MQDVPGRSSENDEDGDSESGDDDDYYEDDSDGEGGPGGMAEMLALLQAESEAPTESLVVHGKRRRTAVDYAALNAAMFGDTECYDGEGTNDGEFTLGQDADDAAVLVEQSVAPVERTASE